IFVGMRRGGHSYYALDVTDRHNPVLLWQKHGQYVDSLANIPAVSAGYERMGQSWSALTPVRIRMGNTARVVLLAGGGYDPDEDGTTSDGPASRFDHDIGNTIYMIDPNTGEVLWDAHDDADLTGSMTSSFPSDVVPVDRNADGFIDMFYATDVGGRVWRFDLDINATDMADFAKGGVIADLNDSTTSTGNRRFYNAPDISYITEAVDDYILISVGSGYRAHPLATTTTDYHYLIKDLNAKVTPEDYIAVTMSDLAEWGTEAALNSPAGWYVPLTQASEKILSRSVTVKGSVFFSTYAPLDATTVADCGGDVGTARLYIVNVYDPLGENLKKTLKDDNSDSDSDSEYTGGKFVKELDRGGLAPAPVVVFTPGDDCGDDPDCEVPVNTCESMGSVTLVGPEAIENGLNRCDQIEKNYWREL
uniref:PilC/PilY family type IV pilus protein n=1 Tax=Thalassolituus sp. TaxID=2030822 RepID=UPI003513FB5E